MGRFASPDSIVPDPGDPQALNRYAYALNQPLRYTDPSGYDPLDAAWEEAFRAAHGRDPTDDDRRDRLFSLIFPGSGPGGEWTDEDWAKYASHNGQWWTHGDWPDILPAGLDRFILHVERLLAYYMPWEQAQFVAAFAFIWGGVPLGNPILSAWDMATPANCWAAYPPLYEGSEGWRPELVDDKNPSHHYAGLFYMGYFFGASVGLAVNWLRDGPLSEWNPPDIRLGNIAAIQAAQMAQGVYPLQRFGDVLRYALSVRAYIWPTGYPY